MQSRGFWCSEKQLTTSTPSIVSTVPSLTETLAALGLSEQLIGLTKFCVHPSNFRNEKSVVGGTKSLHLEKIEKLSPGLILGNKEENLKEQLQHLAQRFPVFVTDITSYNDALNTILDLTSLTDKNHEGKKMVDSIQEAFKPLNSLKTYRVVYLIWKNPYMTVGGDTFISSMLKQAGFINCLESSTRYPQITLEEIEAMDPDYLFLSSEPFPFQEKHLEDFVTKFPLERIKIVDGEYFSWYGSRMIKAASYFEKRLFLS